MTTYKCFYRTYLVSLVYNELFIQRLQQQMNLLISLVAHTKQIHPLHVRPV